MAGRRRRGGSDGCNPDLSDDSRAGMARNRREILRFMYGYYEAAFDALPLEHMPALAPRLLDAGVCFGFADPVTNIIANTVCFLPDEDGEPEPNGAKKRKMKTMASGQARARDEILSKIVAGDVPSSLEARTIAERSLEGLVSFLTSYFRYLPTWDTLRYLCLARADLLVAVHLIEHDRCYRRKDEFGIRSHTAKTALKCAACSARQPNIDAFLTCSFSLVSHLSVIAQTVPAGRRCRLSIQDICWLSGLLLKPVKLKNSQNPMKLAALRLDQYGIEKVPPMLTESLRGVLLDKIRVVYLKAISRMPMEDFRSLHHHGLLKGGYCYGPFSPISNIIVNTVWYGTAFPAAQAFELDMICTRISIRTESRSLDGLINLLRARISEISEHDAMVYLLKNNLKVCKAVLMARQDGHNTSSCNASAYKAAADAARHPEPEAYVQFAIKSLPVVSSAVKALLTTHTLSSSDILCLSRLLSPSRSYPSKSLEPIDELTKDAIEMLSSYKENFFTQQKFVRRKVEAALQNCEQTKGQYELRVICAVNDSVGRKSFRDLKYPYSHVNFWASPKAGTSLTLFFAEVSNDEEDDETQQSFCRPVLDPSTNVRCCYCEFEGTRIVHPVEGYCGGAMDFEKMASGRHTITNARIISHGELKACPVGILGEEYIYFDPARDANFIRAMNQSAWAANLDWGDEIRRIRQMRA
ncbi:uncharacterized protein LOC133922597 [Phragmites australis]|uniref:uncharacterized protein LOC133922597 n=1 Tax=Phragmites australis TaxID=29695 RepID=UPI002D76DADE|nr:uncharacterized protein LOC133922597 [Phragmites australis]